MTKGKFIEPIFKPQDSQITRRKVKGKTAIEISVELAPCLYAYGNYQKEVEKQKNSGPLGQHSEPSFAVKVMKHTFNDTKNRLASELTALAAGDLDTAFEMAMGVDLARLKQHAERYPFMAVKLAHYESLMQTPAYQGLADGLSESLVNMVDNVFEQNQSLRKLPTSIKATTKVSFDVTGNEFSIVCAHKGSTGFPNDFLERVKTAEQRITYANKTQIEDTSERKRMLTNEVRLPFGGASKGLAILMKKVPDMTFYNETNPDGSISAVMKLVSSITPKKDSTATIMNQLNAPQSVKYSSTTVAKLALKALKEQDDTTDEELSHSSLSTNFSPKPSLSISVDFDESEKDLSGNSPNTSPSAGLSISTDFEDEDEQNDHKGNFSPS